MFIFLVPICTEYITLSTMTSFTSLALYIPKSNIQPSVVTKHVGVLASTESILEPLPEDL